MKKLRLTQIFFFLFFLLNYEYTSAVPAYPHPVRLKQPDGTEISVLMKGDEKIHWMESPDGYTLMYNPDKAIVYASLDAEGDMVPSSIVAGASLRSSSEELQKIPKGLRYSETQKKTLLDIWQISESASNSSNPLRLRASEESKQIKAICALIGTSDKPFSKTVSDFEALMNQSGYNLYSAQGSVRDFYKEDSYGKIDMIITVVGPYTAAKKMSYYGTDYPTARELGVEAANFAFREVNPADYDNDGDGWIDTFHYIFSGYGEEAGGGVDCIWPHKWEFASNLVFGTKKLKVYSCSAELRSNSGKLISTVGVICHEMGHVFGAPDYYDQDNENSGGKFAGTGTWDLMGNGNWNGNGHSPAHTNMFQKIAYGWVSPIELKESTTISNMPNAAFNPVAYTIKSPVEGEYYILENRQQTGFDRNLPGHGLLIYHATVNNRGQFENNNGHTQKLYPVCASSSYQIPTGTVVSYGSINSSGCPFPGSSGNTAFTDYSTPWSRTWSGAQTQKPITNISESNGLISFRFMETGIPATNLRAVVSGQTVKLNWDRPLVNVNGYAIYRDGVLISTLNDPESTEYTQRNTSAGTYNYCVAALYDKGEAERTCTSVSVGGDRFDAPVTNLNKQEYFNIITLTWENPSSEVPDYYIIYRDGVQLATTHSATFKDTHVPEGRHLYCVSYKTGKRESEQACCEVISITPDVAPVTNLKASVDQDLVTLNWDAPTQDLPIGNTDDSHKSSMGGQSANYVIMPIRRFDLNETQKMNGMFLKEIRFILGWDNTKCVVKVWQGGNRNNTGTLVWEKELPAISNLKSWQTITIDKPIAIDPTKELCIGILETAGAGGGWPASYGFNECIDGKTNLYSGGGSNMSTLSGINWNIAAVLETEAVGLTSYSIYRNGAAVGFSDKTTFTDKAPALGEYNYEICAVYTDIESGKRNILINVTSTTGIAKKEVLTAKAFPTLIQRGETMTIRIEESAGNAELSLYSIFGTLIRKENVSGQEVRWNADLEPGIYFIKIKNGQQSTSIKFVVK